MEALTPITFDKPHRNYNTGDLAGFGRSEAAQLCAVGVAHLTTDDEMKARDAAMKAKAPSGPEPLVAVKITGSVPRYNRGDTAGFPAAQARQLVEVLGVAIYTDEAKQARVRSRAEITAARLEAAKDEKKGRARARDLKELKNLKAELAELKAQLAEKVDKEPVKEKSPRPKKSPVDREAAVPVAK
jgi:hypothetical protein